MYGSGHPECPSGYDRMNGWTEERIRVHRPPHKDEDAFMVPGMGAQPVPVKEWVPANDNIEDGKTYPVGHKEPPAGWRDSQWDALARTAAERFPVVHETLAKSERGQYIGLTRKGDPNGCADDLAVRAFCAAADAAMPHAGSYVETTTSARPSAYDPLPLRQLGVPAWPERTSRKGPYIATATGGKFYPLDPRPSEVDIRHIARSHSMQCRYNGAVRRFYSVAEHVTLIARSLVKEHGKRVALAGLLHDAPGAYTGFGDVVSPMKVEFSFIGEMEDNIYRKAIAPHFGLSPAIPHVVHMADMRIRGNEVANLVPMAWHEEYDNPLPVPMMYWSPAEAEREFLATYTALTGDVV